MATVKPQRMKLTPLDGDDDTLQVIVETPRNCRNKFKFDEKLQRFKLSKVLPAGAQFPYDFGYIPGTLAEDGDPIDVLLLMDEAAFPGCVVGARLIGVIEGTQTESGTTTRNDRLIAVAKPAHDYRDLKSLKDINENLLKELEHFFISYNSVSGKEYRILGLRGPKRARRLLDKAIRRLQRGQKRR